VSQKSLFVSLTSMHVQKEKPPESARILERGCFFQFVAFSHLPKIFLPHAHFSPPLTCPCEEMEKKRKMHHSWHIAEKTPRSLFAHAGTVPPHCSC
jgi:hypothetical protein